MVGEGRRWMWLVLWRGGEEVGSVRDGGDGRRGMWAFERLALACVRKERQNFMFSPAVWAGCHGLVLENLS